jgi:hypothetical protein
VGSIPIARSIALEGKSAMPKVDIATVPQRSDRAIIFPMSPSNEPAAPPSEPVATVGAAPPFRATEPAEVFGSLKDGRLPKSIEEMDVAVRWEARRPAR